MGSGIGKRADEKASGALARIIQLEQGYEGVLKGLNESFGQIESRLHTIEELVTAITMSIGTEQIQDLVLANRKAAEEAQVEAAKVSVAEAVSEGKLVATTLPSKEEIEADEDGELCSQYLVIGKEIAPDGEEIPPGRLQLPLSRIKKDVRALLAGAGPGTVVNTNENQQLIVQEVYMNNPNPPTANLEP